MQYRSGQLGGSVTTVGLHLPSALDPHQQRVCHGAQFVRQAAQALLRHAIRLRRDGHKDERRRAFGGAGRGRSQCIWSVSLGSVTYK